MKAQSSQRRRRAQRGDEYRALSGAELGTLNILSPFCYESTEDAEETEGTEGRAMRGDEQRML
jgi:hypothetical protein